MILPSQSRIWVTMMAAMCRLRGVSTMHKSKHSLALTHWDTHTETNTLRHTHTRGYIHTHPPTHARTNISILFNRAWSGLAMPFHANLTIWHLWSLSIALHNIWLCTSRHGNYITHHALPLPRPCVNIEMIREMFKGNQYLLDADLRSVFLPMNKVRTSRE
jgi:hypothetical protein